MVVFTCNHCGDSIQKPKAAKHYETKCRNNYPNLCCVDCLKDFKGDEFKVHTTCVSEAERYGGKGFVAKPSQNKGEKKQNAWIEIVQSVLDDNKKLSGSLRYLLEKISVQPNTPRKKPKFFNFVRSMERKANMKDIESAWDLLSSKLDKLSASNIQTKQTVEHNNKENISKDSEPGKTEETATPEENGLSKKEKKKLKKKEAMEEASSATENGGAEMDQQTTDKRGKKRKHDEELEPEVNGSSESNVNGSSETNKNQDLELPEISDEKVLSKKELKQLKKKAKYEAQIKEIEMKQKEADAALAVEQANKQKHQEDAAEPKTKKVKKDCASEFDWKATILSVLGSKGKDISVKKLQKRVFAEYCTMNEATEITERIMKKFNKSLNKIPNLKVENDKVFMTTPKE